MNYDVVIIGGGPAGSTLGSLLKRYAPDKSVLIVERERFPREHVGESQLPPISLVLEEMGCWEKVEAAGFPIKIGATYRWGSTKDLWDFEFLNGERFVDEPRPARFEGQRRSTAFQVDRAIYDKILLDHAGSLGCEVREETKVVEIERDGDSVEALVLEGGDRVTGRHYVDASGGSGILRRKFGVEVEEPSSLRNIAIWDYWENADWAVEIGTGGTRVQVLSVGFGWLWFIPMGPTRTSIGLVCPAEYYKRSGKTPAELYQEAIRQDPLVSALTRNATSEGSIRTTRDWSFVAKKLAGENWFLVGESAGFADPILAAGMTLAQIGAQNLACTILEIDRGEIPEAWLKSQYADQQRTRLWQHIRFADYWYSHNTHFSELQDLTQKIAADAGIETDSQKAWQWLGTGGFITHDSFEPGFGGYDLETVKRMHGFLAREKGTWSIAENNVFRLEAAGAVRKECAIYGRGYVLKREIWDKGGKTLPMIGMYERLAKALSRETRFDRIVAAIEAMARQQSVTGSVGGDRRLAFQALEAMVDSGWVSASFDPRAPRLQAAFPDENEHVHRNRDNVTPQPA